MDNPAFPVAVDQDIQSAPQRHSGRTIKPPERLIEEIGAVAAEGATAAANYEIALSAAEVHYYATMKSLGADPGEFGCVGTGLGGGFENTQELHVKKYKQAMQSVDKENWEKGVSEEHERMKTHKVWEAVPR